jgi:hypothetical protein
MWNRIERCAKQCLAINWRRARMLQGKARRSKPVSYSGWSEDELLRVFAAEDLIRI